VVDALQWARRVEEQGLLPNAGGYYDQSAVFVECIEQVWKARHQGECST